MKPEILPPKGGRQLPGDERYVVVATRYPTTYGANSHLTRSQQQFAHACDIDLIGSNGKPDNSIDPMSTGFENYSDALELARKARDANHLFTDHHYTDDDDAPFDSADLHNTDNDEEVLIQVLTKTDFVIKMHRNMQMTYGDNFEANARFQEVQKQARRSRSDADSATY